MKNQRGFAILEAVLILVIIAIVGGVGWYVVKQNKDKDQSKTETSSSSAPQEPSLQEIETLDTSDWKNYTDDGGYTFSYPSDWSLDTSTEGSGLSILLSPGHQWLEKSPYPSKGSQIDIRKLNRTDKTGADTTPSNLGLTPDSKAGDNLVFVKPPETDTTFNKADVHITTAYVFFNKSGNKYLDVVEVSLQNSEGTEAQHLEIFETILKTISLAN